MKWIRDKCSWRRVNKLQTILIIPVAIYIMATDLREAIWVLTAISLWTWWLAAAGAWRSDE